LFSQDDLLKVSFLDVGQGDAIFIQTPGKHQILIDGGPDPERICLALGKELHFWDRSIDLLILTHPHLDHLTGLIEVVHRYRIGKVIQPEVAHYYSPVYAEWRHEMEARGIKPIYALRGQKIDFGDGVELQILHPSSKKMESVDDNGIVVRLDYGKIGFLFPADIRFQAEEILLHQGLNLKATVLKVAHHGGVDSTTPQFLDACDPVFAVVSVGQNVFGHPAPSTIARLEDKLGTENVFLTKDAGTITFTTDGEKLRVKTEKR
jgi:competence protein ComEC